MLVYYLNNTITVNAIIVRKCTRNVGQREIGRYRDRDRYRYRDRDTQAEREDSNRQLPTDGVGSCDRGERKVAKLSFPCSTQSP